MYLYFYGQGHRVSTLYLFSELSVLLTVQYNSRGFKINLLTQSLTLSVMYEVGSRQISVDGADALFRQALLSECQDL